MSGVSRWGMAAAAMTCALAACQPPPGGGARPAATAPAVDSAAPAPAPASPAAAKRAPGDTSSDMVFRAFGTEPFWNLNVEGERLVWTTPENQAGTTLSATRVPSLVGIVMHGEDAGQAFTLDVQPGACSDGMSDNRYDHVARFEYRGQQYRGCAEMAR